MPSALTDLEPSTMLARIQTAAADGPRQSALFGFVDGLGVRTEQVRPVAQHDRAGARYSYGLYRYGMSSYRPNRTMSSTRQRCLGLRLAAVGCPIGA